MKIFYQVILLFVFPLQAQTTGLKAASDYLLSNSPAIVKELSNCDSLKMRHAGLDCDTNHIKGKVLLLFESLKNVKNEKDADKFIQSYLGYLSWVTYALYSSPIISDSINIRFLIKLLQAKEGNEPHMIAFLASNLLKENTSIDEILKNKEAIKKAIGKTQSEFQDLMVLISTTPAEKEALLKQNLSIGQKARLGDTAALNEMISHYNKMNQSENYEIKRIEAEHLVHTQQPKAIKAVIENINAPFFRIDFEHEPPCTLQTLRMAIMFAFTPYFPKEHLFCLDFRELLNKPAYLEDSTHTNELLKEFSKLIKKKYNVSVPLPLTQHPLGRHCNYFIAKRYPDKIKKNSKYID